MKTLDDLTAPREYVKAQLESELRDQCVQWWRRKGPNHWSRKFQSMSQRSVPDDLFAAYFGPTGDAVVKFACEFKRPGTPRKPLTNHPGVCVMSTPAQYDEQQKMIAAGWFVFECDDFEVFKETVNTYLRNMGVA